MPGIFQVLVIGTYISINIIAHHNKLSTESPSLLVLLFTSCGIYLVQLCVMSGLDTVE